MKKVVRRSPMIGCKAQECIISNHHAGGIIALRSVADGKLIQALFRPRKGVMVPAHDRCANGPVNWHAVKLCGG